MKVIFSALPNKDLVTFRLVSNGEEILWKSQSVSHPTYKTGFANGQ